MHPDEMTEPSSPASPADQITRLIDIVAKLRDPQRGCPWDQIQTFDSIARYTIEEAYEVADAIIRRDWAGLPDELGDLLLQVVYYASMAETENRFDFATVARLVADKMVRRHPHVFGEAATGSVDETWENTKADERRARAEHGVLAGIPVGLPALSRSSKLCARAARVGFDWTQPVLILEKIEDELTELRAELADADPVRLQDEIGDVLFTAANLARALGLDPEACLRHANTKFQRRFEHMERLVEETGKSLKEATMDEMEAGWQAAKQNERRNNIHDQSPSNVS
jgi:ATP diphosphatase